MARRIYLPSSGTAPVTPGSWNFANQINPLTLAGTLVKNDGSAMTTKTEATGTTNPTARAMFRWVIGKLKANSISGTVKAQMRGSENNAGANATLALAIKIVQPDGTDRSVLLAQTASDSATAGHELTTTLTNMSFQDAAESASISITTQTPTEGDYLVIEMGFRSATGTSRNISLSYGNNSATDLPEDTSTTAANNPWIEFSSSIAFISDADSSSASGSGSATATGASIKAASASSGGTGAASATGTVISGAAGSAAGSSIGSATGSAIRAGSGSSSGIGQASAVGATITVASASGSSAGVGQAAAVGDVVVGGGDSPALAPDSGGASNTQRLAWHWKRTQPDSVSLCVQAPATSLAIGTVWVITGKANISTSSVRAKITAQQVFGGRSLSMVRTASTARLSIANPVHGTARQRLMGIRGAVRARKIQQPTPELIEALLELFD